MSNADWYSRKLGQPQAAPSTAPVAPPVPNTYVYGGQAITPVNYDPNQDQTVVNAQAKAQSTRGASRCPECNSGNYMKVGTQSNQGGMFEVYRCYDCGYPKMQTGSGAISTGGSSAGTATPAKQVGQSGGFQPNVIVDRIG